jgi:hypothetical protein
MMNQKKLRYLSAFMLVTILNELIAPSVALALTSGPSQPEVQSFEPFNTSEMVNIFSGDLTYNIPLMDIEGYPLNLSYSSGVSMDQEASWVGLGWNINPGVINRNMRGVPDDYRGDVVTKEFNLKPNTTYGVNVPISAELFAYTPKWLKLGLSLGMNFNSYNGIGMDVSASVQMSSTSNAKGNMTMNLGISLGSESGLGINPSLSFDKTIKTSEKNALGTSGKIGMAFNSRRGLSALTFSSSVGPMAEKDKKNTSDKQNISAAIEQKENPVAVGDGNGSKTEKAAPPSQTVYVPSGPAFSGGSSISFGGQTFTPTISMSMLNVALSTSFTGGFEIFGLHPNINLNGYFSGQYLMGNSRSLPAYGYMNAQYGQNMDDAMMDFNREKDGSYSENTPALPLTNFTYDLFSVSGQGIGGMYRPFRSDWGYVFDNEMKSYSIDIPLPGIELGAGNLGRGGLNMSVNGSNSRSGKWSEDNPVADVLKFRNKGHGGNDLYEDYYFKQAGEKVVETDPDMMHQMGDFDPVRVDIVPSFLAMPTMKLLVNETNGQRIPITENNFRKARAKRNEVVTTLTAEEASIAGLSTYIESFPDAATSSTPFAINSVTGRFNNVQTINRVGNPRKAHHISEISTYRSDGTRYIYGIPAYNHFQRDVTFAVSGRLADEAKGLVSYNPDGAHPDNSAQNENGIDNYFERITNPSYAHSYLLTAVLGANYVDLTDDGPTYDDLGGYTKFNYSLTDGYGWRTPFEEKQASHNEGFKTLSITKDYNDDKASYIYGQKELWYVHSIETKNYVALFYTSKRKDGYGVKGENGGGDAAASIRMKQLDSIVLYSRQDLIKNGVTGAMPIKTAHFKYDYSQCKGIVNHESNINNPSNFDNGKLTLKEVWFTYGKSEKGRLSSYLFEYGQVSGAQPFNPKYNMKGYDRWGNYKLTAGSLDGTNCDASTALPQNGEYPYTDQNRFTESSCNYSGMYKADIYAHAWTLTTIKLPSGGEIKVDYESDDYAYVQNRRAMQMMKVVGAFRTEELGDITVPMSSGKSRLLYQGNDNRNNILFDITDFENINPCANGDDVKRKYFCEFDGSRMRYLYFKFFINLKDGNSEYVPGHLKISDASDAIGLITSGGKKYAYVRLQEASSHNAIAFTAWNFTRLHLPRLAYNQPDRNMSGVMQIFKAMASMAGSLIEAFEGFADHMRNNNFAMSFDPNKSFIRVETPNNMKKGGGCRVKRITSWDNWQTLTGNTSTEFNADYGQEYSYTTKNEYGSTISSGVASYEPSIGGDENPFKQPVFYTEDKLLAPDDDFYQEEPYGESFFPSPSIGYSKVTVRSIPKTGVKAHSTGKVVHEFYTAKDFPTITRKTTLVPYRMKPNPVFRFLNLSVEDYTTVSQGFSVELNDMHGKPKAQWVYGEQTTAGKTTENPISGMEYKYKQSTTNRIDNNVNVISKDGKVTTAMVGVEVDQVADFREQKTVNRSGGFGGNLDAFLALIFPIVIPIVLPSYSSEDVRFRSAVVTKVINRYALPVETITYDDGSSTSSKNLAIDAETGEVLLTESTNTFGDKIYHFTYPAHWVYDNMGPAYRNIGYAVSKPNNGNIDINTPNLVDGDELLIKANGTVTMGWVSMIGSTKYILDDAGNAIAAGGITYLKVVRSGRKNQQSTPVGSIATLDNPIVWASSSEGTLTLGNKIIDASAIEYSDDWKIFCECDIDEGFNKVFRKRAGAWRVQTNWTYLTARQQSLVNNNTNVRTDGVYENFNEFWEYNPSTASWRKTPNIQQWQFKSASTIYSPYGLELESIDPLGRYSAAMYGYGNNLPTAISGNAQYREMGFDGFEDYEHMRCFEDHFSYKKEVSAAVVSGNISINGAVAHTGKKSLKVKPTKSTTITRRVQGNCK